MAKKKRWTQNPAPTTSDTPTRLVDLAGTHRAYPPEQTLRRIEPIFDRAGITRLADVTRLDDVGIPVYQAIRPNAKTLSVSQGKGLTDALAKVSAAMESIEIWHAEKVTLPATRAPVGDLACSLPYRLADLNLQRKSFLHENRVLEWVPGRRLDDFTDTLVPERYVALGGVATLAWTPPLFDTTSNGLASGNTLEEAVLHGLYEVIERDSIERCDLATEGRERAIDLATVDTTAGAWLLEKLEAAGVDVMVYDLTGATGIPAFSAQIWSPTMPLEFEGSGCHLDPDVALSRALTEAAQSRLTVIAGTRDNVSTDTFRLSTDFEAQSLVDRSLGFSPNRSFAEVCSRASLDAAADLSTVVSRVKDYTGISPIVVDLTRDDIGLPVVKIVAPGLRREHLL